MVRHGFCLTFLTILAGFVGCSSKCTNVGCSDDTTVGVSVRSAAASPQPGIYVFQIVTDKESTTLTCNTTTSECIGESQTIRVLVFSAWALDVLFDGEPTTISIRATRNGSPIGSATFMAQYITNSPNGPDCAPTCRQVSVTPDPPTLILQ